MIRVANSLNSDQARHFVGPDLDPNSLQRLLADHVCIFQVGVCFKADVICSALMC